MEVILRQAVPSLGKEGDVVRVAHGYANNYLIPRGMAVLATRGELKQLEQRRTAIERREAAARSEAQTVADRLSGKTIDISVKVGEEGRLFGSVTPKDIAAAIKEQLQMDVDRRNIDVSEHIKEAGSHEATIHVYPGVEAKITVNVAGEAGTVPGEPGAEESEPAPTEETGGE